MGTTRRDFVKLGVAAGGGALAASPSSPADSQEWREELLKHLCPPDNRTRDLGDQKPSPYAQPWVTPLYVPPIMEPTYQWDPKKVDNGAGGWQGWDNGKWVDKAPNPLPDPAAHQRYDEFHPRKLYEIHEVEARWRYHKDPPYTAKKDTYSWSWCWWTPRSRFYYDPWTGEPVDPDTYKCPGNFPYPAFTPGPTCHARYGEPVLFRRFNSLPSTGLAKVNWALPSTTSHLHNGHTASESDGNPQDWIDSGEFWDHHYANFPLGFDPREKLTTLWYHDHRLDFTAANVYAGLAGFWSYFDDEDTGDENTGWRLPSGRYDVPLMMQDAKFFVDKNVDPAALVEFDNWNTDGQIGDLLAVNRVVAPHFKVERRKYRFRFLNGGPSRFYQLFMRAQRGDQLLDYPNFHILTGDGNFQPEPVWAQSIFFSVAQRVDVILDFSNYKIGDQIYVHNLLEQHNGAGPSGRYLEWDDPQSFLIRFDVARESDGPDNSQVPAYFRPLPEVNLEEVKQKRTWVFDYDGGLWTINGRVMDPNRIDAGIEEGSAELWTFVNGGNDWSHPIHSHFSEFLVTEINGKPFRNEHIQSLISDGNISSTRMDIEEYLGVPAAERKPITVFMGGIRRDVATLLPGDEVKLFMRWKDFLGKHVMHCHNVVHEDHAMMIRWDIMEPGRGFLQPKTVEEVYDQENFKPPYPDYRPPSLKHLEERPGSPTIQDG